MINNITFPDGITWKIHYVTGADFLGSGIDVNDGLRLYAYAKNKVVEIGFNTSNMTSASYMFTNCNLSSVNLFDTSNVTNMSYMFDHCISLRGIPKLITSNVTNMSYMFGYCNLFTEVPQIDVSKVTDVGSMFISCGDLKVIPDMNFTALTNFGTSAYSSWVSSVPNLRSIGVIDCDKITNIGYVLGGSNNNNLTHLGGFRNLGKASSVSGTNSNYFLYYAPNLTYESVMNVLNLLYDRASAGLSVLTLKLHPNHLAMLSEDDIAVATNKGWTLV